MKKVKIIMLIVFLAGTMVSLNAQIQIKTDGGVKIGTLPVYTMPSYSAGWQLGVGTKGLEVSAGEILFHTPQEGQLRISGESTPTFGSQNILTTTLTGLALSLETASNYVYTIFTRSITSRTQPTITSDDRYKENILDIPDVREKVLQLRPVSYDLKVPANSEGDTMNLKNKVGFIAQEVQPLFPHLVGYIAEVDQYTLDYTSFIPYLTQVIQTQDRELQEQKETNLRQEETILHQGETISNQEDRIEELSERMAEMERILSGLLSQNGPAESPTNSPQHAAENDRLEQTPPPSAQLFQNIPNPFSERTMIRYELPKLAPNVSLQIYDANGRRIKNISLPSTPGTGQIEISGGELLPGIYTYSLVVSGRVVDTKRMVLTR